MEWYKKIMAFYETGNRFTAPRDLTPNAERDHLFKRIAKQLFHLATFGVFEKKRG